jgi:hypothetical protein
MLPSASVAAVMGPADVSMGAPRQPATRSALVLRSGCTASQIFFFCTCAPFAYRLRRGRPCWPAQRTHRPGELERGVRARSVRNAFYWTHYFSLFCRQRCKHAH